MSSNQDEDFFKGYGDWGQHVYSKTTRSILPDLKPYLLPDDIKNKADAIYNIMFEKTRRKKIRKQLVFYCTYCAHLELGIEVNPVKLGEIFGLEHGDVLKCPSLFSFLQTGYSPPDITSTPMTCIKDFCAALDLSNDAVEQIRSICDNVMKRCPDISQENPQTVASGLLKYYIFTNGIELKEPNMIATVTKRSNVTIDAMYKRIAIADNTN